MQVTPETGATIEVDGSIIVTAKGADDLRIMLWAEAFDTVDAAKDAYYDNERVFSAILSTISQVPNIDVKMEDGEFTITINQAFIDILEAGTRYEDGNATPTQYDWSAGDKTTWLITPETGGELWEEYATWDGEKVNDTLFVYNLGTEEPEVASTYSFDFEVPEIKVNEEATINVTFANDEPAGDFGYEGVRFKFAKTEGTGDATFTAIDSNDKPYLATNEGYWGPGSGFDIDAVYNAMTPWAVTFSEAGTYEFEVSLIYAPEGEVVAGITETITVEVLPETEKEMTVAPTSGTIEVDGTITVTAEGADDLRIMLWAEVFDTVDAAKAAYADKVFSSRIADLKTGGMDITKVDGVFTITIDQDFIDILEAGRQYGDDGTYEDEKYTWSAGDATTWLITPETDGDLWEEYATWDGEKVNESLFVYNIGTIAEPTALDLVNNATEETMAGVLEGNAEILGINLDSKVTVDGNDSTYSYNELMEIGRESVASTVFDQKELQEFSDETAVQEAFANAVFYHSAIQDFSNANRDEGGVSVVAATTMKEVYEYVLSQDSEDAKLQRFVTLLEEFITLKTENPDLVFDADYIEGIEGQDYSKFNRDDIFDALEKFVEEFHGSGDEG
jgi:hypothetical protein